MSNTSDSNELARLRSRIAELETENAVFRSKFDFFCGASWMASGLRGEKVIAELLGGELTPVTARHDIVLRTVNLTLEIKLSRLNRAVKGRITQRWQWAHILGSDGGKLFDRVILMGDADTRYCAYYADPASPYVMFDVPFEETHPLMNRFGLIQISTNPLKARTPVARALFSQYQTTQNQLRERYRTT
jgi:hypothetical protein